MSVREQEEQRKNCSSRGLGIAAAAIGVGVGAALYCFFSKGPENPDVEGSTSGDWRPQTLHNIYYEESDSEYMTVSEHSTTDTSIDDDSYSDINENSVRNIEDSEDEELLDSDVEDLLELTSSSSDSSPSTNSLMSSPHLDNNEWELTDTSLGIPEQRYSHSPLSRILINVWDSNRGAQETEDRRSRRRSTKFRQRSWSLEECSICFEVMLKDQELMALPCTHNFHLACIGPWLQQRQTCPNCRKAAE